MRQSLAWLWLVRFALVLVLSACGSRSALRDKYAPPTPPLPDVPNVIMDVGRIDVMTRDQVEVDVRATVDVACPAPLRSTQSLTGSLDGAGRSNVGRPLTYQWEIVSQPMGSATTLQNPMNSTSSIMFDVGGEYRFRLTARDDLGNSASCETRADVESAIDLLCPNDQSNFQGSTLQPATPLPVI